MKGILILLALVLSSAAQAEGFLSWRESDLFPRQSLVRQDFLDRLQAYGIDVRHSVDCVKPGWMAKYNRQTNQLCMNPDHFDRYDEMLTHEAVHVLQDCLAPGGIQSTEAVTIIASLRGSGMPMSRGHRSGLDGVTIRQFRQSVQQELAKTDHRQFIKEKYRRYHYDAEAEAYALESYPELVYAMLGWCEGGKK